MSDAEINLDLIKNIRVNEYAILSHSKRYKLNKKSNPLYEIICLLNIIRVIDLTTLSGDDTVSNLIDLINKALYPLSRNLSDKLSPLIKNLTPASNVGNSKGTDFMTVNKVERYKYVLKLKIKSSKPSLTLSKWEEESFKYVGTLYAEKDDLDLHNSVRVAAVCVYPQNVEKVVSILKSRHERLPSEVDKSEHGTLNVLQIASVAAGFPSGQYPLISKLEEIVYAISKGATEIDVVIDRSKVIGHKWLELYDDLKAMRRACNNAKMKTILSTGECGSLENIYRASMIAMMAGCDTIKTSTGKEAVNATFAVGVVMCRAILKYYQITGVKVGFKPAGGIKTVSDALQWLRLILNELGPDWLPLFRIGASGLLSDIVKHLEQKNLTE